MNRKMRMGIMSRRGVSDCVRITQQSGSVWVVWFDCQSE